MPIVIVKHIRLGDETFGPGDEEAFDEAVAALEGGQAAELARLRQKGAIADLDDEAEDATEDEDLIDEDEGNGEDEGDGKVPKTSAPKKAAKKPTRRR